MEHEHGSPHKGGQARIDETEDRLELKATAGLICWGSVEKDRWKDGPVETGGVGGSGLSWDAKRCNERGRHMRRTRRDMCVKRVILLPREWSPKNAKSGFRGKSVQKTKEQDKLSSVLLICSAVQFSLYCMLQFPYSNRRCTQPSSLLQSINPSALHHPNIKANQIRAKPSNSPHPRTVSQH